MHTAPLVLPPDDQCVNGVVAPVPACVVHAQATEAAMLQAGVKAFAIASVGDDKQLPPTVKSQQAK